MSNAHTPEIVTSYLSTVMDPDKFNDTVKQTVKTAKHIKKVRDFDTSGC